VSDKTKGPVTGMAESIPQIYQAVNFFTSVIAKYQISATLANQFCPKNL